jgi:hypothetical protein
MGTREVEIARAHNLSAQEEAESRYRAECDRVETANENAKKSVDEDFGRRYLEWDSKCAVAIQAWEKSCNRMKQEWAAANMLTLKNKQVCMPGLSGYTVP